MMWKIIAQLFIALSVINSFNLVHGDIKDDNIFIDEDKNLKLEGCGICKELSFDFQKLSTVNIVIKFFFFFFYIFIIVKSIYNPRNY
jgi:serine/threonine protein kinase